MGGVESFLAGRFKPLVRYHSNNARILTLHRYPVRGQFQVVSLTGAVASQKVTEAHNGFLKLVGNQLWSAKVQGSLIERQDVSVDQRRKSVLVIL